MRYSVQVLLGLVSLSTGFVAGRHFGPPDHRGGYVLDLAGPELQTPARVSSWGGGTSPPRRLPERVELTPYRIVVNGERVFDTIDGEKKSGDVWQIDLAAGRIMIYAMRSSAP